MVTSKAYNSYLTSFDKDSPSINYEILRAPKVTSVMGSRRTAGLAMRKARSGQEIQLNVSLTLP